MRDGFKSLLLGKTVLKIKSDSGKTPGWRTKSLKPCFLGFFSVSLDQGKTVAEVGSWETLGWNWRVR